MQGRPEAVIIVHAETWGPTFLQEAPASPWQYGPVADCELLLQGASMTGVHHSCSQQQVHHMHITHERIVIILYAAQQA